MDMKTVHDFQVKDAKGQDQDLSQFKGKVLLFVNTASKCGFTPQYDGLQKLYEQYQDKGFEILGFPCNQFAGQEKGSDEEIQQFCKLNFGVTFPVFAKIKVNGRDAHPLYQFLTSKDNSPFGGSIKWNFTKFLIDKNGNIVHRFEPNYEPAMIAKHLEELF